MTLRATELIPEPCPMRWEEMAGDGARRWCAQCRTHVLDLSELEEHELRALAERDEPMCVQVLVDPAGTIVPASRLRRTAPTIAATALATLVACTPHVRPAEPAPEIVTPAPIVAPRVPPPDPDHHVRRMGGAIMGRSSRSSPLVTELAGTVPCDTIAKHTHGRPTGVDGGRALLEDRELGKADLLARCDP